MRCERARALNHSLTACAAKPPFVIVYSPERHGDVMPVSKNAGIAIPEKPMLRPQSGVRQSTQRRLAVSLARSEMEILEAQKLRYSIFAEEMGAQLNSAESGIDADDYDGYCDHLLVRDLQSGEVVGTYRMLPPRAAQAIGSYYSDREFDLSRLAALRSSMVELGRSCIHADYRTGAVITLLWSGLARYLITGGYTHLVGCASISMADGGHGAASLYFDLAREYLSPPEYRVFPRCALPLSLADRSKPELPPLIKGYLRMGAYVCGEPAWDADFNTADLLMLLPMSRLNPRYAKHYLGEELAEAV